MNFRVFIEEFENWRANNGYPKREECREFFRTYRDLKESNKSYEPIECFEYILSQQKPAMFLDTLFKRDIPIPTIRWKCSRQIYRSSWDRPGPSSGCSCRRCPTAGCCVRRDG